MFRLRVEPEAGSRIVLHGNEHPSSPPFRPSGGPSKRCSSVTRTRALFVPDNTYDFMAISGSLPRTIAGSNELMLEPIGGGGMPRTALNRSVSHTPKAINPLARPLMGPSHT